MNRSHARMLDANFNRAREGARVVEEYARFLLDHPQLSRECKAVRHELQALARAVERALHAPLSAFRDTLGDVGTRIGHRTERRRASQADVLRANMKRLQESLRVLEEHGKWLGAELHARFERLRYRAYTLEQRMEQAVLQQDLFARPCRAVAVAAGDCTARNLGVLMDAVARSGVKGCLLRAGSRDRRSVRAAGMLRAIFPMGGGLLLVADNPALALRARADGVVWEAHKPSRAVLARLASAGIRSGSVGSRIAWLKKQGCRAFETRAAIFRTKPARSRRASVVWVIEGRELFCAADSKRDARRQVRGSVRRKGR